MKQANPRIDRIAYIGWRGVDGCEVLDLDSGPLTGLVGPTGAGKSTLTMCLGYALLPDRKALDIRPISEVKDARKAGIDMLAASIDPRYGYAYVALDIATRAGGRLIAGIYVEQIDGRAEFTRWLIDDPKGMDLHAVLTQEDGDQEFTPTFPEWKRHCAARGLDVVVRRTVGEYCQALYEAGVLPSGMAMGGDRSLYASLIETTFKGGVSNQVVSRLKDYLLPEATQIPDIVSGLQTCTNEVIMTKNEVASAERELSLLQSTYGVGKEIVLHSLRWASESSNALQESLRAAKADMANMNATHSQLTEDIPRIGREIEQAERSKESARRQAGWELKQASDKITTLTGTVGDLKAVLVQAQSNKGTFDQGKRHWQALAGPHANQTIEWVRDWIDTRRKNAAQAVFEAASEMKTRQTACDRLNGGLASILAEKLAERTGGETLESALSEVSDREALALELALCGLTDGVVGIEPDALTQLPAWGDLPDTLWLGMSPPEPRQPRAIGDWYVSPAAGGYVAVKKDKAPVFGSKARDARRETILGEIGVLQKKHADLTGEVGRLEEQKTLLAKHEDKIAFYLAHRGDALAIDREVSDAAEALSSREKEIIAANETRSEIERTIEGIEKPYEEQLKALRANLSEKERKLEKLDGAAKGLTAKIAEDEKALAAIEEEGAAARSILAGDYVPMIEAANNLEGFDQSRLLVEQTKRISALGIALADEPAGRLAILQDMDPANRLATLRLWPILMSIVRERVSIDRAEIDGEDMIQAMKDHRAALGSKLVGHENEVRIKARNLHQTIGSQASMQKRKIDKLSRLGEGIAFGNVTGVRIVLTPRDDMLSILEGFAEQLFSEKKPVDVALKEWFDAASGKEEGFSLTGEQLLDYRNYVDLSIEACRKGSGWAPAASLSGGESIGSGLAIALMLTRSIAMKGEIKVDQITPLFAVDEAHRLDGPGHAVIVDFAKREGFQVVVAAPELTPSYSCILYALNRVFDPNERLIIRGIRVAG